MTSISLQFTYIERKVHDLYAQAPYVWQVKMSENNIALEELEECL